MKHLLSTAVFALFANQANAQTCPQQGVSCTSASLQTAANYPKCDCVGSQAGDYQCTAFSAEYGFNCAKHQVYLKCQYEDPNGPLNTATYGIVKPDSGPVQYDATGTQDLFYIKNKVKTNNVRKCWNPIRMDDLIQNSDIAQLIEERLLQYQLGQIALEQTYDYQELCEDDHFCQRFLGVTSEDQQTCVIQTTFESTRAIVMTETCKEHKECLALTEWSFNKRNRQITIQSCPQAQCPLWTYRGDIFSRARASGGIGAYLYVSNQKWVNAQHLQIPDRGRTRDVYKYGTGQPSSNQNDPDAEYLLMSADYAIDYDATRQPGWPDSSQWEQVLAPFQCQYDDCNAGRGQYLVKGNTDTGPVPLNSGLQRRQIPSSVLSTYGAFGAVASANQGRCAVCPYSYQSPTEPEPIYTYLFDGLDTSMNLASHGLLDAQSRQIGSASLGCYACPIYQTRGVNGGCVRNTCASKQQYLLSSGEETIMNYVEPNNNQNLGQRTFYQGQCVYCPANAYPDINTVNQATCRQCDASLNFYLFCDANKQYCECKLRCPAYNTEYNGLCILPPCTFDQIFISDGTCQTCNPGYAPNTQAFTDNMNVYWAEQRKCQLQPCPFWQRHQAGVNNLCASDVCNGRYYNVKSDQEGGPGSQGTCRECPMFFLPTFDRRACALPICSMNEVFNEQGVCYTCPAGSVPKGDRACGCPIYTRRQLDGQCRADQCTDPRKIITVDGLCIPCDDYKLADSYKRQCVDPTCTFNGRTVVRQDATCLPCGDYQVATGQYPYRCDFPSCYYNNSPQDRTYITRQGICQPCGDYLISAQDKRSACVRPLCGPRNILLSTGALVSCGSNEVSSQDCLSCSVKICQARYYLDAISPDCQKCPDYQITAQDGNSCVYPSCASNQYLTIEGGCLGCDPYNRPVETRLSSGQNVRTRCAACQCNVGNALTMRQQYCDVNGYCQDCQDYSVPDWTNQNRDRCVEPNCPAHSIITTFGGCSQCQPPLNPDSTARYCTAIACGWMQRIVTDQSGLTSCVDCPSGTRAQNNYQYCGADPCLNGVVQNDGTCQACASRQYYDASSNQCLSPVCQVGYQITLQGQLERCPNYSVAAPDCFSCVQCACGLDQICMMDGTCRSCDQYQQPRTVNGLNFHTECYRPTCSQNSYNDEYGNCLGCPACSTVNSQRNGCTEVTCPQGQALSIDGQCQTCTMYQQIQQTNTCGGRGSQCVDTYCGSRYKKLVGGQCEACPAYYTHSLDGYTCILAQCPNANEVMNPDTTCRPCENYYVPDGARRTCVKVTCPRNQILQVNGQCDQCPMYTYPDEGGFRCITCSPNNRQVISTAGTCSDCPEYTYPMMPDQQTQLSNGIQWPVQCISAQCSAREILQTDGYCFRCAIQQRPSNPYPYKGATCISDTCSDRQILSETGTCIPCREYTRAQDNQVGGQVCGPDICNAREQLLVTGLCRGCTDYTRGNGNRKENTYIQCLGDTCEANEIRRIDGTCMPCGPFERANQQTNACEVPVCQGRLSILMQSAEWERCPDWTRADETCRFCRPDACIVGRERLLNDGTCASCPAYERTSVDGRSCEVPVCRARQNLLEDGTCETCPPFWRANPDGRSCLEVICTHRERLLVEGVCEPCEAYTRALHDGKTCGPEICSSRQALLPDGTCQNCPDYERALDMRKCGRLICNARQILLIDGRCADCYPYTRASADGLSCEPHYCNDRQMLGEDGGCIDCPAYTRAQGDGTKCDSDPCNSRQKITQDGTCEYCPLFESVCQPDQRCCSRPSCGANEIITKAGQCQECAYHERPSPPDRRTCEPDPSKKAPDPIIMAKKPVLEEAATPACCTTAGCDVWNDEQFLSEEQATGFYMNQSNGNLGFIFGHSVRLSMVAASIVSVVLIAVNAL